MLDIYFEENYGKLYENIEDGVSIRFVHQCEMGTINHLFIKRKIPINMGKEDFYDIVTPYGYGGPIIIKCEQNCEQELVKSFEERFKFFCLENNIVSEFVRFHPIVDNRLSFEKIYNLELNRKTLGTNLTDYDDPFSAEFSKSCRKNIKKALKEDITYKVTENPTTLNRFMDIYYSTMDRNKAVDYYYFDEEYFNNCLKFFKDKLLIVEAIYNDETIAMGLYFKYEKYIHIHLSGTLTEYLYLSPAYILRYAATLWGKENNYELIHHGGGRTNSEEDSLFRFKKQFSKNTHFDFYVGKKIWNKEIYNELCNITGNNNEIQFFPAYRNKVSLK